MFKSSGDKIMTMENTFRLEKLENRIKEEIYDVLKNKTDSWLLIALDNENADSNYFISAEKMEIELVDILWNGIDNNYKVLKNNLNKILEIKSQYNSKNALNNGFYTMNCNDITGYLSHAEFLYADCDCERFMTVINQVYDKIIDNIDMYVKVLQDYMTDSRKCDTVESLLNLLTALQTIKKIRE